MKHDEILPGDCWCADAVVYLLEELPLGTHCCCCSHIIFDPFRAAVPFWGQTTNSLSSLSPKRDCGSKGVNSIIAKTPFVVRGHVLLVGAGLTLLEAQSHLGDKPLKF